MLRKKSANRPAKAIAVKGTEDATYMLMKLQVVEESERDLMLKNKTLESENRKLKKLVKGLKAEIKRQDRECEKQELS